jgi:hypothetical protein
VVCFDTGFGSVGIDAIVGKSTARAGVIQRMKISSDLGVCVNPFDQQPRVADVRKLTGWEDLERR